MNITPQTLSEKDRDKLDTRCKLLSNYGKKSKKIREDLDALIPGNSELISTISEDIQIITKEILKHTCEHYNYPYSNGVLFVLGETRANLDFHMRSKSMIFSNLFQDHKIISRKKAKEGDIVVYFTQEDYADTPEGDKMYSHIGKICEDGRIISQFGEGDLGIYKHNIPHVFSVYGDSVVFMRIK